MSIWRELSQRQRGDLLRQGIDGLLNSLTPYQRDCLYKVHIQQACREPVDPVAERVIKDAKDAFDKEWKARVEANLSATKKRSRFAIRITTNDAK